MRQTILLVAASIFGLCGCKSQNTGSTELGRTESKLAAMEKQWIQQGGGTPTATRDEADRQFELLRKLFTEYFTIDERKELPRAFHTWPEWRQRNDFQSNVIYLAYVTAIEDRQRDTVVRILAEAPPCPERTLEYDIVRRAADKFDAPILILCDAYEASTREDVRTYLLESLHRAFYHLVLWGPPDLFVQRCRSWYLAYHWAYEVDPRYAYPGDLIHRVDGPLFIERKPQD